MMLSQSALAQQSATLTMSYEDEGKTRGESATVPQVFYDKRVLTVCNLQNPEVTIIIEDTLGNMRQTEHVQTHAGLTTTEIKSFEEERTIIIIDGEQIYKGILDVIKDN